MNIYENGQQPNQQPNQQMYQQPNQQMYQQPNQQMYQQPNQQNLPYPSYEGNTINFRIKNVPSLIASGISFLTLFAGNFVSGKYVETKRLFEFCNDVRETYGNSELVGGERFSWWLASLLSYCVLALAICTLIGGFVDIRKGILGVAIITTISAVAMLASVFDGKIDYCGAAWLFLIFAIGFAIGSIPKKQL